MQVFSSYTSPSMISRSSALHALCDVTDLRQRIERAHGIAGHDEQARRLGGVGGVDQVHGAGDIGLDPDSLDILVVGAGAGHFQHGLAGIHREVEALAPAVFERAHQQAVAAPSPAPKLMTGTGPAKCFASAGAPAAISLQVSARPP